MDFKNAYGIFPVHADDHPLLAIWWGQDVFPDTPLPFGLWSTPKIFPAFADTLAWVMLIHGVQYQLHYLDNFLFLGGPASTECVSNLETALQIYERLGVPVASHKTGGPTTCLTFFGIQIDTMAIELSLALDKLSCILGLVLSLHSK